MMCTPAANVAIYTTYKKKKLKKKYSRACELCVSQQFSGNDEPGVLPLASSLEMALD